MTATYPVLLPAPVVPGYKIKPAESVARTEMESGPARQRRRFTATPTTISVQMHYTLEELALFEAWYRFHAHEGAAWFSITLLGGLGLVAHEARFLGQPETSAVSPRYFIVAAQLEIRDRPTLDEGGLNLALENDIALLFVDVDGLHHLVHFEFPPTTSYGQTPEAQLTAGGWYATSLFKSITDEAGQLLLDETGAQVVEE